MENIQFSGKHTEQQGEEEDAGDSVMYVYRIEDSVCSCIPAVGLIFHFVISVSNKYNTFDYRKEGTHNHLF